MGFLHKFIGAIVLFSYLGLFVYSFFDKSRAKTLRLYVDLIYFFQVFLGGLLIMMGEGNMFAHYLLGLVPFLSFLLSKNLDIRTALVFNILALSGAVITGMGGAS